ncbi:MAG: hypothetical protein JSV89_09655 [Spirochaetaceae bacterium]|nr:MAG: hypothetical protein JSV89_09655 [Spirochaetaceae bacterium]
MSAVLMNDYKRRINELQKDIERNIGEIHVRLGKLGEHISYQDAKVLPNAEMEELHTRIQELRRQLPESRQRVKRILQTVADNEELEREIRNRKLQIAELGRINQEICETIGRAAYQAYKTLATPNHALRELFEPLEKQEQELADLEAEQESLQANGREGKFFRIFRETGRSVYVKGLLSLRRRAAVKAYYDLGKRFCASRLKDDLKDSGLQAALAPYETNERKITTLQREMDRLEGEQENKWSELKSLGAYRSHQKRVRDIESEIERIEEQLRDAFEGLGSLFRAAPTGASQDTEASSMVNQIEEIEKTNRNKKKLIERLNAALQIESLNNQLENLADRISKLEREIESRHREIETLRSQVAEREKKVQRLQKIRGSKQALLSDAKKTEKEARS